jgi:hypothetical protein
LALGADFQALTTDSDEPHFFIKATHGAFAFMRLVVSFCTIVYRTVIDFRVLLSRCKSKSL